MLPLIAAFGVGALAYKAYGKYQDGKTSSERAHPYKKPMSLQEKNLQIFRAALFGSAIHSDGVLHSDQKVIQENYLKSIKEEFSDVDDRFISKAKSLLDRTVPFSELRNILESVDQRTEGFADLRADVEEIVRTDSIVVDEERAFLFKCELLFEGILDAPIFKHKLHIEEDDIDTEYLRYLSSEDVRLEFPETPVSALRDGVLYTVHPSNNKELIPFDGLLSDGFATSKHAELINAAREAGASRIRIEVASSQSGQGSQAGGSKLKVKVASRDDESPGHEGNIGGKKLSNDFHSLDEGELIEYTFEGSRAGGFFNFNGATADDVLSRSRWLRDDDNLVTLVKGFFSKNKVLSYEFVADYQAVGKAMRMGELAAKCGFPCVKASLSSHNEEKSEAMMKKRLRYHVEF